MKKRKLRKSEWIVVLAPLIAFAAIGGGPLLQRLKNRYFPEQLKRQARRIGTMAFSPDGRFLAVTSVGEVRLWDLQKRVSLWAISPPVWNSWPVFSNDSKYVAWMLSGQKLMKDYDGGFADTVCEVYDVQSGRKLHSWPLNDVNFQFLPDNQRVIGGGSTVRVWNLRSGKLCRTLSRRASTFEGVTTDEKGRYAVVVEEVDSANQGESKWSGRSTATLPKRLRVLDISSGQTVSASGFVPVPVETLRFNAKGDEIELFTVERSGKGSLYRWAWRKSRSIKFEKPVPYTPFFASHSMVVGRKYVYEEGKPNANIVATELLAEDENRPSPLWRQRVEGKVIRFSFLSNARYFVTQENGETTSWITIRQLSDGNVLRRFRNEGDFCISPDGKTLAVAADSVVKLWDVSDLAVK